MAMWQIWLTGLAAVSVTMVAVWIASLVRRDASLVDRVWGPAFAILAWTYAIAAATWTPRTWLVLVLVTVWAVRLGGYITWRNWGEGEDKRYRAMRERNPQRFAVRSLVTIFLLQGVLAWFISLPLLAATVAASPAGLIWTDYLAVAVWIIGFAFEAGGDWQLARFLADPANRGRVMDRGFWRYTRHPNYFGDATIWWAFFLVAVSTGAWWAIVGSLAMTFFIVRVSGVALTDRNMAQGSSKREGYDDYVRRTNAFIPWFPKD